MILSSLSSMLRSLSSVALLLFAPLLVVDGGFSGLWDVSLVLLVLVVAAV